MAQARLVLSDGTIYRGKAVGAVGTSTGEAVFNTGLTGYQEVLTDPSYRGQIVTMTYPEIGNYGVCAADMESDRAQVAGFVMRRCCHRPSNFRSEESLPEFLARSGVVGIEDIDTRALTRRLRVDGAMPAIISSEDMSDEELVRLAKAAPSMAGQDLASSAGTQEIYEWTEPSDPALFGQALDWEVPPCRSPRGRHRLRREAQHLAPAAQLWLQSHRCACSHHCRRHPCPQS